MADFTCPWAVILKRFLAPDLVLSLGILISFDAVGRKALRPVPPDMLKTSVLKWISFAATAALDSRAARGRVYGRGRAKKQPRHANARDQVAGVLIQFA